MAYGMNPAIALGSELGRSRRRMEHSATAILAATGPAWPRWPVEPLVAACLLAFGCGPAWAANGGGGVTTNATAGAPPGGAGGIDGTAGMAAGGDGAHLVGIPSAGGGGGGTDLTTGQGAAGGRQGIPGVTNTNAPGATGAAGAIGLSTVSAAITGGAGQTGLPNIGVGSTGGGGGGAGVTTTVDLAVGNAGQVTGGVGGIGGSSGGGGGGGVGVFSSANVAIGAGGAVTGGAGGRGSGLGGSGGGAAAVVLTGGGTVDNSGALAGGNGGASTGLIQLAGAGGSGGEGVLLTQGGTVLNRSGASITGGTAGANGTKIAGQGVAASVGGVGIKGASVSIINAGAITGGLTTPGRLADAIRFTGGINSLELQAGSRITGNVVAFSTADTLALGGDTGSSFDVSTLGATAQYQGFGIYRKTGTSIWTLTGTTTAVTPWTLAGGTLSISSDGNLGDPAGALTFDGGTLQTTANIIMNRTATLDAAGGTIETRTGTVLTQQGQISGAGSLTKTGDGTLTLTADNTYTGATTIAAGTLALAGTGSIAASSRVRDDGAFDIAATTAGASIRSLSGGGTVNLGAQTLTLTAAADTFGGVIQGTGGLTLAGGVETLTGANTYTGATTISAGTLVVGDAAHANANIGSGLTTIAAGATLGGYGSVAGSVSNSGTVTVANALASFASGSTGTFRIGRDLDNAGLVNLAASSGRIGNVLNVGGNYTGANGQVVLNTLLNEGGAASQSDRFVVGGNVGGSTAIKINQSGSGAQTVGNGIQLVQVNGRSAANSFHLSGPVQAGAYQYLLYQGGATDPNGWYLRTRFADATDPATSPPSGASIAAAPIAYRPAVVGYSVTPLLNADYGFSILGRLQERVGDVASGDAAQPAHSNGVWGRIGGQNLDANAGNRFSADVRTFFAQFGKDWTLARGTNGGNTHAGATLTFGSTSASFGDSARSIARLPNSTGTVETQAQSIGGYWTKYLPDGSYIDGVGQLTHYQNRYGDIFGGSGSQNGFGAGVSGEVGKPFALGSTGVAIEPQAQLLYQYLHLNHFDDGISPIGSNTTNALRGRLGFRLFKANLANDSKTSTLTPYFTADVLHDFFSPGKVTVGGTTLGNELGKTWYAVGVGITGNFAKRSDVYANVKYGHSMGGEYRRNVFGQVGYRFNW